MSSDEKPVRTQLIRVVYPTDAGRIALRTEENWDLDIKANSIQQNGRVSEFRVETERPYFYFKPVLLRDGATMWSRGENFLAVATSGAPLEIHPYFREDTHCSVCELMPPLASPSGAQHRFRVSCRRVTTRIRLRNTQCSTCTTDTTFSSRRKPSWEIHGGLTKFSTCWTK